MIAPIILFVYNRPQHLKQSISSLQCNALASESDLYIYSDAAKDLKDKELVNSVREEIRIIKGFKSITIIEREENWGLAKSVIDGVTTLVNKYGRVIVLEDDLIVAPHFLTFMNDALELYKEDARIGHIQGCDFTKNSSLPDTFFIKWTGSWGWATWKRAWDHFNPNGAELLEQLKKQKKSYTFDFNGAYPYTRMLKRQVAGKNNSWAIRWNATLFLKDMLSLNVGKSLVQNRGFDGSGTNCGAGNLYQSTLWEKPIPVKPILPVEENKEARKAYIAYYKRTNSFWAKAKRRIIRTLKGDFGA